MSALDWSVVAAGLAAIAWVNWYFFLAERRSASTNQTFSGAGHASGGRDVANDAVDHGK